MKQFESSLLHDKLKEYFGFSSFKGNQEAVIRNVLEGRIRSCLCLRAAGNPCAINFRPDHGGRGDRHFTPDRADEEPGGRHAHLLGRVGIAHFLNSSLNKTAVAQVRADVLSGRRSCSISPLSR